MTRAMEALRYGGIGKAVLLVGAILMIAINGTIFLALLAEKGV